MAVAKDLDFHQIKNSTANTALAWDETGVAFNLGAFVGAALTPSPANGTVGLVPKPFSEDTNRVLKGSGLWVDVFPFAGGSVAAGDGNGNFAESNLIVDSINNTFSVKKTASSPVDYPYSYGVMLEGGFDRKSVTGHPDRYMLEFLWEDTVDTPVVSGTQDRDVFGTYQDAVAMIEIFGIGVKNDGSEGYSCRKVASFRRDGAAAPVQIGTTTTLVEHRDDNSENPTITIAVNAANIRVSYTAGGGSTDLYSWTIWAKVTFATL